MAHACEWETSMMLRLAPHLVGNFKQARPVESGSAFEPASRAWITKDRSEPGHLGSPALATAEKGEALFGLFADGVVAMLERVIQWDGKSWSP
jgi:creatinine amidohydrolase